MRLSLCRFLADFNELTTFMATSDALGLRRRGNYGWHRSLSTLGLVVRSAQETFAAVQQKHYDDDHAVDHLAAEFLHLHHRQDRLEERDQDHAGHGAQIGAAASEDRGTAEDH